MRLSDVKKETKPLKVQFDAGVLEVEYRPNSFTADAVDQINAAMADTKQMTVGMFKMINGMLVSWDLEDDDGDIIPLDDMERLKAEVPMGVFGRIFAELQKDQNPGNQAGRS